MSRTMTVGCVTKGTVSLVSRGEDTNVKYNRRSLTVNDLVSALTAAFFGNVTVNTSW